MSPKTGYEKQKAVRANKRAAGMVRFEKWVFPEVREPLHKEANRLNQRAERARVAQQNNSVSAAGRRNPAEEDNANVL